MLFVVRINPFSFSGFGCCAVHVVNYTPESLMLAEKLTDLVSLILINDAEVNNIEAMNVNNAITDV